MANLITNPALAIWVILVATAVPAGGAEPRWLDSYPIAVEQARQTHRQLLVAFCDDPAQGALAAMCRDMLADEHLGCGLSEGWVLARVARRARMDVDGTSIGVLDQPELAEMHGLAGLAVFDFRDETAAYYGEVVSVLPIGKDGGKYRAVRADDDPHANWPIPYDEIRTLVELPPGSLTQRTLIFAVRVHADHPESTTGRFDPVLAEESTGHAEYQADHGVQGHQNWERRFHRINAKLPGGLLASEVCAESWPGQSLVEAARDCVHCWRQSSGHWSAVRARHTVYGYDMKRGSNGIWYATGIFGRAR